MIPNDLNQKESKKWLIIALVLVIVSFGLFAANPLYQYLTTKKVSAELKVVTTKQLDQPKINPNATPEIDESNDEIYIAKIAIPAVKLSLPIVKGTGDDNLFRGAATNTTTQELGKGNYSLSAHKMPFDDELLFSPLLRVKLDDLVYLTDGGLAYIYHVTDVFVVTPDQVDILDEVPGKIMTTLYTCETDAGTERHVVQAELDSVQPYDTLSNELQSLLEK